jgi:ketosteroid isomerase-like protein
MSRDENIQTIRTLYDAFGRGDVQTILAQVTDDVDWASDAAEDTAPWWGVRKGRDAVGSFFADVASSIEVLEFTPVDLAASDDAVMSLVRFRFRGLDSGLEASANLHHYFRFRDGKVEYYRGSEDTALSARVVTGSRSPAQTAAIA